MPSPMRIIHHAARDRDQIGLAGGDDFFGLMGVRDHANRHSGHAGFPLHPFGEGNLVALAGRDFILRAYREAVGKRYRFYSYGDAMFIHH